MDVNISLTKNEIEHLVNCDYIIDCCETVKEYKKEEVCS